MSKYHYLTENAGGRGQGVEGDTLTPRCGLVQNLDLTTGSKGLE